MLKHGDVLNAIGRKRMARISSQKVTTCHNCSILEKKLREHEEALEALDKLILWYEEANSIISAHRIKQALKGIPPV